MPGSERARACLCCVLTPLPPLPPSLPPLRAALLACAQLRTVSMVLTSCLRRNGVDPDVAPLDPADTTKGPSALPIKRQQLRLICVDSAGQDCTAELSASGISLALGWATTTDKFVPSAQTYAKPGDVSAAAAPPLRPPPRATAFPFVQQADF